MRLLRIAATVLFATAAAHPVAAQQTAEGEAGVRAAVEKYLEGHATGSGEPIRAAFQPELYMMFVRDGAFMQRSAAEFIGGFSGQPAPDEAQRKRWIEAVDVTGTAAVAKVVLDYPAARFTDYFTLLRVEGEWKIVNKIFHVEPKARP